MQPVIVAGADLGDLDGRGRAILDTAEIASWHIGGVGDEVELACRARRKVEPQLTRRHEGGGLLDVPAGIDPPVRHLR
jgi:hypothetical protein